MTTSRILLSALYLAALGPWLPLAGCDLDAGASIPTFAEFQAHTYREPGPGGVYIVDGDTPIGSDAELRGFYDELVARAEFGLDPTGPRPHLAINTRRDRLDKWSPTQAQNLIYCISWSFEDRYLLVVNAMKRAAQAWEGAANVNFIHRSGHDEICAEDTDGVMFNVSPVNERPYYARAFLPSNERRKRQVLIDSSAFDLSHIPFDLAGVLRHELGHVLGFRHEQIRPEAGVCAEDSYWVPLTPYDRDSVMHYPHCNGNSQSRLDLTELDRQGARAVYP